MRSFVNKRYPDSIISGKIIGCAIEVHRNLGRGFQEGIYQNALMIEFTNANIEFQKEKEFQIYYKGQIIGNRRMDFLVENKFMLETKAVSQLEDWHLAQAINYLEAYDLELGLLINFGSNTVEVRRIMRKNRTYEPDKHFR